MVPEEFISVLIQARRRLSSDSWHKMIDSITAWSDEHQSVNVLQAFPGLLNPDAAWLLNRAMGIRGSLSWAQVTAILSTVDVLHKSATRNLEVVWSGPPNGVFPVRRTDQVLYDLIQTATRRILLVTFAAHRIDLLCKGLIKAIDRGVSITLILEAEAESGGQLSHDALNAFKPLISKNSNIYYWPFEKRERNPMGRPGKLHVKCAVIDSEAIIGSANLTDDAFNRNMELGILINESIAVDSIFSHFMALIEKEIFQKALP